MTRKFKRK